jgi:hypothetical protein
LAANGGNTLTIALLNQSPAIDAGDDAAAPATDQRHLPRSGLSDIGACEFQTPVISGFTPTSGPDGTSVTISGTNFHEITAVRFGGSDTTFTHNSPTMITAVVPVYATTGVITVVSSDGTGYSASDFVVNTGDSSAIANWLLANDFPSNSDLQADPNGDGVNLLMAYALNLDPNQNLKGSMPRPVLAANHMSLTFYAGSEGVTYMVESSADLKVWNTEGVSISAPDANHCATATIPMSGPKCFMRLVVVH